MEKTLQDFLAQVGGNPQPLVQYEEVLEEDAGHQRLEMDEDVREERKEQDSQVNGFKRYYTDPSFDDFRKKEYLAGKIIP